MSRFSERLRRGESGQGMAEFAVTLPFLLLLALGVVEVGRMLETAHAMSNLTREGANAVSRGSSMQAALSLTVQNQEAVGLGKGGRVIVSRVRVQGGVPRVVEQVTSTPSGEGSRVGAPNDEATPYLAAGLVDGRDYYVVELFIPYRSATPFHGLVARVVPETLYDRSLF